MKLSRTMTGLLAVALVSFMVSDVMAQGRRPGGGGPPGGGFGQRGGPGGGGGGVNVGDVVVGLLRIDAVKVEIELSPDQDEAVAKLMQPGERPDFSGFRDMSEEERREAFVKMQQEREERTKKTQEQLEEVLLPEQMERLHQIAVQQLSVRAFGDKDIAKDLKITDAQEKGIEEAQTKAMQDMMAKMQGLRESGDRDAMREAFTKMREESEAQVLAVLDSGQKKKFEEMKGKKFDMPEGAFGGGRGGPGGGFGGGRGGPGGRGGGEDGGRRRGRPPVEN